MIDEAEIPETVVAQVPEQKTVYGKSITLNAPDNYYIRAEQPIPGNLSIDNAAETDFGKETSVTLNLFDGENRITYYLRRQAGGPVAERHLTVTADITAPEIAGAEDGAVYCPEYSIAIQDAGPVEVTVNGEKAELSEDGKISFTEPGEKKVTVTDAAGNVTEITFTVKDDHAWDNGTVTKEATCSEPGEKTFACERCGAQKTEKIPVTSHRFTTYTYNDDATCKADGTETAECDYGCGEKDTRTAENTRTEHKFTKYTYNDDATCTEDGTETAECDYGCGEKDTRTAENTRTDHKFTKYTYNNDATCTADGTETAECDYGCGEKDTRTAENTKTEHKFTKYTFNNDATCAADGTETAECDYGCGEKDTRPKENTRTAHQFIAGVCRNCGEIDPDYVGITVVATASTENLGTNGWYRGDITLNAPEGYYIREKTAADTTVTAENFGTEKAVTVKPQEGINTIRYSLLKQGSTTIVDRAMTLRADTLAPEVKGAEEGKAYCKTVKLTVSDAQPVTVRINNMITALINGEVTVSTPGDKTLTAADSAGNVTTVKFKVNVNHIWEEGAGKEATCTEAGERVYTCTVCGETRTETVPATAHRYSNYVYNNDATCQADGTKTAECDFGCGTKDTVPAEGTKTEHRFTNYVYNNDATCTADGTKTAECEFGCGTKDTVPAEGTKTAHRFTNYVYNNDATCQADGTKTAVCDFGCGTKDTVPAEGTKTEHRFTNYVFNNNATCMADGTKTASCEFGCGTVNTIPAEGTKVGHRFINYVYDNNATCTADGTKTAACEFGCGMKDTITAPGTRLAHTFVNGVCSVCKTADPNYQPTTAAPTAPAAPTTAAAPAGQNNTNGTPPVLGIFDESQPIGMFLITFGAILAMLAAGYGVSRARRK